MVSWNWELNSKIRRSLVSLGMSVDSSIRAAWSRIDRSVSIVLGSIRSQASSTPYASRMPRMANRSRIVSSSSRVTRNPFWGSLSTRPSFSSMWKACRTGVRLAWYALATSSCISLSPGRISLFRIFFLSRS